MKPKGVFSIVEYENATGSTSFRVTGTKIDGTRIRKNFSNRPEAEGELSALNTESLNTGVQVKATRLTSDQLTEAENAFRELAGKPLMPAVRFYLENFREALKPITVADAYGKFLEAHAKEYGSREDTIRNLRNRVRFLVTAHGPKLVSNILPEHIRDALKRSGSSPVNQDNDRRAFSSFLSWCVDHEHCKENVAKKKTRQRKTTGHVEQEQAEIDIMSLPEVRKMLDAALRFEGGKLIPYVVLGTFCAIRPRELSRLSWNEINLKEKTVTISAKISKVRGRRIVEIPANAIQWLMPHSIKRDPIKGKNWRREFDRIKAAAGFGGRSAKADGKKIKPWVQDIMRHTGISHHLAYHQHEGKTAQWAGNSPDVIQRHYKGLVNAMDAKTFWRIAPNHSKGKSTFKLKSTLASSIQSISEPANAGKR